MDLILCHTTADFDALGAAVGLSRIYPGSKIVLTGGAHPPVRDFLALHRDEYALIERRSVNPKLIRALMIVDSQNRDRIGACGEWLDLPNVEEIIIYDHHEMVGDIRATEVYIDAVGASTTLVVEELKRLAIKLSPIEATAMALGIHVDTGSLTFDQSTSRDAIALGWLMEQGANLKVINEYLDPGLSNELQDLLKTALSNLHYLCVRGYTLAWVILNTNSFVPGLSSLASQLRSIAEIDVLLLAHEFPLRDGDNRLTVIGRSQIPDVNLNELFQGFGGGGHSQAAALNLRGVDGEDIINQLVSQLKTYIPQQPTARDLMSSPVRTIRPETTIAEAQRILLRYTSSGLSVVDTQGKLVGIISRRDIDIALHHGFSHAPVKGYMTLNVRTITPETTLPQIQALMVTYDIGRLPVIDKGELVGMVTRTDILRELHQAHHLTQIVPSSNRGEMSSIHHLEERLAPQLWQLLTTASRAAETRGWHLYLVGGAVRDMLLAGETEEKLLIKDIDLVVDGFHQAADVGAGVELAKALQADYPRARLDIHGAFQTAALLWHKDPKFGSLWVDIATARTEFYPYPAANPEVEASSIRQDLYRRDFTINAIALRLTSPRNGELLDFFGGILDIQTKQIRVLHPNSFIEDPTRIYRGVRFATRLGFGIEPQTEAYIRYAVNSGIFNRTISENRKTPALQTRLKAELKLILQAPTWQNSLKLLDHLDALQCLHPTLQLDDQLLRQMRLVERCLRRFNRDERLVDWLMRLEVLIAHLEPAYRHSVAKQLQLPDESCKRLQGLASAVEDIRSNLLGKLIPSHLVKILRRYDLAMLILVALHTSQPIRKQIWHYGTVLREIQPAISGNDLKQLGYKPGPQFRQILDDLQAATLDGVICDRASALVFLQANYPLS